MRALLGGRSRHHGSTQSLNALDESQQLEDAMRAATEIMNDDVDAAEAGLAKGNSSFHKLGKGVVIFLRATLGFEQEVMREASERLADAEATAYEHQRRAQRNPSTYRSSIYPPGTEFGLCLAESQLMSAVVAVLNESLTESIKGFYKLRKAYITLDGILEGEKKSLAARGSRSTLDSEQVSIKSQKPGKDATTQAQNQILTMDYAGVRYDDDDDDEDEFYDADESHSGQRTPLAYQGHLEGELSGYLSNSIRESEESSNLASNAQSQASSTTLDAALGEGPEMDIFGESPVDIFIHSGSNLCFGILLLIISLIPPAFAALLKIVGFKGDRERAIELLWRASKFSNINGAMAGLCVLGYYNGIVGFCDILPRTGEGAYPKERCKALLTEMRERYPRSRLWLLEEARMAAGDKQLERAVELMSGAEKSPLKQVEALQWFERSLNCMYLHSYEECSTSFQKCVTLNNWSHGLYYYIAGSAHVELYRQYKASNVKQARIHAAKAEELLKLVPKNTGKKKFMARQLPFDTFVNRKIQKWEHRAHEWKVDFIDAIGISPIEEMIFFWNGYKRMRPEHLQNSLSRLAWSTSSNNPLWAKETLDEHAMLAILRAATLRNLQRTGEAKQILKSEILSHDWSEFKGHLKDNWTCPCAHYEMAINLWAEQDGSSADQARLRECSQWLEKVANWESYDLDARIGLRVTTARDTLKRLGVVGAA